VIVLRICSYPRKYDGPLPLWRYPPELIEIEFPLCRLKQHEAVSERRSPARSRWTSLEHDEVARAIAAITRAAESVFVAIIARDPAEAATTSAFHNLAFESLSLRHALSIRWVGGSLACDAELGEQMAFCTAASRIRTIASFGNKKPPTRSGSIIQCRARLRSERSGFLHARPLPAMFGDDLAHDRPHQRRHRPILLARDLLDVGFQGRIDFQKKNFRLLTHVGLSPSIAAKKKTPGSA
jgi:hypothetical protein